MKTRHSQALTWRTNILQRYRAIPPTLSTGVVLNKLSSYLINFPSHPPAHFYVEGVLIVVGSFHFHCFPSSCRAKQTPFNYLFLCLKSFFFLYFFFFLAREQLEQFNTLCLISVVHLFLKPFSQAPVFTNYFGGQISVIMFLHWSAVARVQYAWLGPVRRQSLQRVITMQRRIHIIISHHLCRASE